MKRPAISVTVCLLVATSSGCASVGVSMVGAMLGLGASHQINGISARTFTEPQSRVEEAVVAGLGRMGMKVEARESTEVHRFVRASSSDRSIDVEIESITPRTTRISATARRTGGFFNDGATAAEVVAQAEKSLVIFRQAAGFSPPPPVTAEPGKPLAEGGGDGAAIVRWDSPSLR